MALQSIEEAIKEISCGRMVIVVDDEDRENEGDFVMAAQYVTPQAINFMARFGRGLICTPISKNIALKFGFEVMVQKNKSSFNTAFTHSIGAAKGITTGISVYDRALTISLLTKDDSSADSFVKPGHVFPLIAQDGGVLKRPGHTEAAVDLSILAGLSPCGVICEIMNEDGTMARMPQLEEMGKEFNLKIISIKDLILYRQKHEKLVQQLNSVYLPTNYGDFTLYTFKYIIDGQSIVALVKGEIKSENIPLVRVHSSCFTSDIFKSKRCDCGEQLERSMQLIEKEKCGIIIYLNQEGRGIGLENKIKAYALQDEGLDTVEANHRLGFKADLRDYVLAAQVLKNFSIKQIRLLTNNPSKIDNIKLYGIDVVGRISLEILPDQHNQKYLSVKKQKMGHLLSL